MTYYEVWYKFRGLTESKVLNLTWEFSVSTHRCFVDTGCPSSTTRLYVDHDGQANVNCARKKTLNAGEYATRWRLTNGKLDSKKDVVGRVFDGICCRNYGMIFKKNWECHRGFQCRRTAIVWLSWSKGDALMIYYVVWYKFGGLNLSKVLNLTWKFAVSTHRCYVDTGNPSSTTRLYVDHDGQLM